MRLTFASGGCNQSPYCSDSLQEPNLFAFASNNVVLLYNLDLEGASNTKFWRTKAFPGSSISSLKLHKLDIYTDTGHNGIVYLYCGFQDGRIAVLPLGVFELASGQLQMRGGSLDPIYLHHHSSTINCIDARFRHDSPDDCPRTFTEATHAHAVMVAASSDGSFTVWNVLMFQSTPNVRLIQHVKTRPMLCLAVKIFSTRGLGDPDMDCVPADVLSLLQFNPDHFSGLGIMAGGTSSDMVVYTEAFCGDDYAQFEPACTVTGHDDWITSIDTVENKDGTTAVATGSHDNSVRLWTVDNRYRESGGLANDCVDSQMENSPFNRPFCFKTILNEMRYYVSLETILTGHSDWIYTVRWNTETKELLSVAANTTAMIWSKGPSGSWAPTASFGCIGALEGGATATSDLGGFFGGTWITEKCVACHSRSGGWTVWQKCDEGWRQIQGLTGHTSSITGLAWEPYGRYLVTASSDRTSRIFSKYRPKGRDIEEDAFFVEIARSQVPGFESVAVGFADDWTVASAGENQNAVHIFRCSFEMEAKLKSMQIFRGSMSQEYFHPTGVPVLRLKDEASITSGGREKVISDFAKSSEHPPSEEALSRYFLWPEIQKLHGQGYKPGAMAASNFSDIFVVAWKSNDAGHAVLRLYNTQTWVEIGHPIMASSLDMVRIVFSPDDRFLLCVGRDRQWAIYQRKDKSLPRWTPHLVRVGHSRRVSDACWLEYKPGDDFPTYGFATASRDKKIKVSYWDEMTQSFSTNDSGAVSLKEHVNSIDFYPYWGFGILAVGLVSGGIQCHKVHYQGVCKAPIIDRKGIELKDSPTKPVTKVRWCPILDEQYPSLACASEDGVLRIYDVSTRPFYPSHW